MKTMRTPQEKSILKGIKELNSLGVIVSFLNDSCHHKEEKIKESHAVLDHYKQTLRVRLYINRDGSLDAIESAIVEAHSLLLKAKDIKDYEENHPQFLRAIESVVYNLPLVIE